MSTPAASDDQQDWAAKLTSQIVSHVGSIRNKTTGPALVASRYAVYLLAIGLLCLVLLVVFFILTVRLLVVATAQAPFIEQGETWLAYYILGVLLMLLGLVLWRRKETGP